ncbi:MAG: hypothetical protein HRF46_13700 [Acidobacteriota bacterium]|jgi:hypothetical protein
MIIHSRFASTPRITTLVALALALLTPSPAAAHCDALDGPVVLDARAALSTGNITPLLKWVSADDESPVRQLFATVMRVRTLGDEAREVAETHFFETVVRLHRASEGAPFTGLKPAGLPREPAVTVVEAALAERSPDSLLAAVAAHLRPGLTSRWEAARAAAENASTSPEKGRLWVAAYVDLVHHVKNLLQAAGPAGTGGDSDRHQGRVAASCTHPD